MSLSALFSLCFLLFFCTYCSLAHNRSFSWASEAAEGMAAAGAAAVVTEQALEEIVIKKSTRYNWEEEGGRKWQEKVGSKERGGIKKCDFSITNKFPQWHRKISVFGEGKIFVSAVCRFAPIVVVLLRLLSFPWLLSSLPDAKSEVQILKSHFSTVHPECFLPTTYICFSDFVPFFSAISPSFSSDLFLLEIGCNLVGHNIYGGRPVFKLDLIFPFLFFHK